MQYIESASLTLALNGELGPHNTTFTVPKDHPAVAELWKWHLDQLLAAAQQTGSGDLFLM